MLEGPVRLSPGAVLCSNLYFPNEVFSLELYLFRVAYCPGLGKRFLASRKARRDLLFELELNSDRQEACHPSGWGFQRNALSRLRNCFDIDVVASMRTQEHLSYTNYNEHPAPIKGIPDSSRASAVTQPQASASLFT